ncbi:outer envelope pore protein 24, chloroplastic-like [Phoenix dactylifera]|uniref:Outer envelope pore protein 24, chloroplastic-like n=1 Tax=Phoenix dactylifera TaxID=42345 RepID=A0A8B8ZZ31_PHODC|nr:outer envelope pore protein 24, chloroplastic-like [Phoenix dactylifera]
MKATLTGKYESIKNFPTASLTVDTKVGDVKLKASVPDFVVADGRPSLSSLLSFALEKPGSFSIDYSHKNDVKFKFMNSVKVLEKAVDLTYTHARKENRTAVEGAVALDASNKIAVSNVLGTEEWKVRYTYAHGALRRTVIEPCYDVKANAWDVAVTRKFERGNAVKATFRTSSRSVDLEWTGDIPLNTTIKISGSINMAEKIAVPKLTAETTWSYEI